jgi:hypothetical protein
MTNYNPFQITRDPNDPAFRVDELELPADLPLARLESRQSLLAVLDRQRARAERGLADGCRCGEVAERRRRCVIC